MGSQPRPAAGVREGLQREDLFTVVIEQFPTDTVDYADIVLPATMQTEHLDVHDGYGHMYLLAQPPGGRAARRVPVDDRDVPPAGARHGARRAALYDSDEQLARTLGSATVADGITSSACRRRLGAAQLRRSRSCRSPTASRRRRGKLEFFSERAARDGHDPLPGYTPPAEARRPTTSTRSR